MEFYFSSSSQHLKRSHEINQVLSSFQKNKVDVILLKGSYLTEKCYTNPALRPMCDIDLLVRKEQLTKAIHALESLNYVPNKKYNIETYTSFSRHIPSYIKDNNTPIEVHWTIQKFDGGYQIELEAIWERANNTNIYGSECLEMNVEEFLSHLCIHIAEDMFSQKILHLYDVFLVLQKEEFDWNKFLKTVREWKAEKAVLCCLILLKNYFNSEIPDNILNELQTDDFSLDAISTILSKLVFRNLTATSDEGNLNRVVSTFTGKTILQRMQYIIDTHFTRNRISFYYGNNPNSKKYYYYCLRKAKELIKNYSKSCLELYLTKKKSKKALIDAYNCSTKQLEDYFKS